MTYRVVIGIDPGLSGAIATLADGRLDALDDMPTMARGKGKNQVNATELSNLLRGIRARHAGADLLAVVEDVFARPGQGVTSMFNFGESCGVIRGALGYARIPLRKVTPQVWKRHHRLLGTDKDVARTRAIELFPDASLARKKDGGRADALLIALWAAQTEQIARAA